MSERLDIVRFSVSISSCLFMIEPPLNGVNSEVVCVVTRIDDSRIVHWSFMNFSVFASNEKNFVFISMKVERTSRRFERTISANERFLGFAFVELPLSLRIVPSSSLFSFCAAGKTRTTICRSSARTQVQRKIFPSAAAEQNRGSFLFDGEHQRTWTSKRNSIDRLSISIVLFNLRNAFEMLRFERSIHVNRFSRRNGHIVNDNIAIDQTDTNQISETRESRFIERFPSELTDSSIKNPKKRPNFQFESKRPDDRRSVWKAKSLLERVVNDRLEK